MIRRRGPQNFGQYPSRIVRAGKVSRKMTTPDAAIPSSTAAATATCPMAGNLVSQCVEAAR